jgi:hypothetical protein
MDKDKVFIEETTNYTTKENTITTNTNNNSTTSLQRGKQNPTKRVVNPTQRVASVGLTWFGYLKLQYYIIR